MPVKILTAPGDTAGKNLLKNGTNYNTVHDATAATNAGNADTKFTLHAKSGSNYFIRRGILLYDFRAENIQIPQNIKIIRAQIILNDASVLTPQTNGDKIRVGWVSNPETFGDFHANDYDKAKYGANHYTSAQVVANGADNKVIELDNKRLLKRLELAITGRTWLHLVIRNELDYLDTTATANNRVWFDRPNADDNPLQLRFFYRTNNSRKNAGSGAGTASVNGFGGDSISAGTLSGFGFF